jgi:excisionase family DNA binding protein
MFDMLCNRATYGAWSTAHRSRGWRMLMTAKEASDFLRISRTTLSRLVRDGRIPAVRIGGRVLFRQESLDELVARAEQPPYTELVEGQGEGNADGQASHEVDTL